MIPRNLPLVVCRYRDILFLHGVIIVYEPDQAGLDFTRSRSKVLRAENPDDRINSAINWKKCLPWLDVAVASSFRSSNLIFGDIWLKFYYDYILRNCGSSINTC